MRIRFSLRSALVVLIGLCVAAAAVASCRQVETQVCSTCGFQRKRTSWPSTVTHEETLISQWYERRIGACAHQWQWVLRKDAWRVTSVCRCSAGPFGCIDGRDAAGAVLALQLLGSDVEFYRHLVHANRDHQLAAQEVVHALPMPPDEPAIRAWWARASAYLADPAAWPARFAQYRR